MGTADPEVRNERLSRLAWSLAAVWLACWLVTVALLIENRSAIHGYADADLIDVVLPIGFAVIGTLVAARRRDQRGHHAVRLPQHALHDAPARRVGGVAARPAQLGGVPGRASDLL